MLFNSYTFIFLFLPCVLALTALARVISWALSLWVVALASIVFYAAWDIRFLPILLCSVVANYAIGFRIITTDGKTARLRWLWLGIVGNLAGIAYYKYAGFLLDNLRPLVDVGAAHITLPIGISFFTFTQIAFLVDAAKERYRDRYSFRDYLLFVTFFPHLVAGPILIHKFVIPQFESRGFARPSAAVAYAGLVFCCCGLFKKVMVADSLAPYVNMLFSSADRLSMAEGWLAALLYTFQLYFDFSGYSEMAVGLALFLNVRIPLNFDQPYRSASVIEFWRRWHISLSRFLRSYLYIPLGGNRSGHFRQMINLMITMLLGGLWHGAGWTFVIWGGLHGAMLVVNHQWRRFGLRLPWAVGWAATFIAVVIAWVFFRAATLGDALSILAAMAGLRAGVASVILGDDVLWLGGSALALTIWCLVAPPTRWHAVRRRPSVVMALVFALMLLVSVINIAKPSQFLYFQF